MNKKMLFALMIMIPLALAACNPAVGGNERVAETANQVGETTGQSAGGSISGWLWHDACASGQEDQAPPSSTPEGCIKDPSPIGDYHADGVQSAQEEPIAGVLVQLGEGECPSTGLAEVTTIATDLSYSFERLQPGTYCVSIDPANEANLPLLGSGIWTSPELTQGTIGISVAVREGGNVFDINFGWDDQSPSRDAVDPAAAIEQAMLDSMKEKGAPTENARIEVQKVADGYAHVRVYYDVAKQPDVWDQGFAYLEDGVWKVWAFGSGIAQEHVEAAGIPRSVWPEDWLTASPEGNNCPVATADTRLLQNKRHGYCLLYPVGYKVEKPNDAETALVVGSLLNATDPRVSIQVEDAAGETADEWAKQIAADFEGFPIERSSVVLGGMEAIVLDKLPGQDINRRLIFEHEGLFYELTFSPADESAGDVYGRMEALYNTIVASFAFIPRSDEWVPEEDCLEAKADEQLLFAGRHNFCVLYPIGYEVAQSAESELVFFVGSLQDVAHPKLFVNVEDAAGRTAEQVADELQADVQKSVPGTSVERTFGLWVGYEPAQVLENVPGQEISRQVIVVHDGRLFKLTFVPADPQAGEVYTQMEGLYTTVIDSFRFLR